MQLVRVAPISPSQKFLNVKLRPKAAITKAPKTPNAAHSVAVAQPAISTQTIKIINKAQGMSCPLSLIFSTKVVGGSAAGTCSGWRRLHQAIYPENSNISKAPGKKPAKKIRIMDASAATA